MQTSALLTRALELDRAHLSVIPIRNDGSKAPSIPGWKTYQQRQPRLQELQSWFGNGHHPGIAIIAGKVSDNLEILDFDAPNLIQEFWTLVDEAIPDLMAKLVAVETPTSGVHLFYRCAVIQGNQKLAQAEINGQIETLIETRGEGGYVLTVGSPAQCHPTGKPYVMLAGELTNIPTITEAERTVLHDCARSFNQVFKSHQRVNQAPAVQQAGQPLTPGQQFNQSGRVRELLERHGWKYLRPGPNGELWARPGVDHTSATLYPDGGLYVFSSNAAPLDSGRVYSPFSLYGMLEHGGDFKAAAKTLGKYLDAQNPIEEIELEIEDSPPPAATNASQAGSAGQPAPDDADDTSDNVEPLLGAQTVEALMNTVFPTPRPILRGLYGGDWGLVVGIGSVGKTTFMNGLVTALTSGRPYEPFIPFGADPKRVLYLDFESNGFRFQKQMAAIQAELTEEELALTNQNFFITLEPEVDGRPFKMTDAKCLQNLAKFCKQNQIDLIVVDTLSQACGLNDENNNSEVQSKIVTPMRRLARHTGAAVLLLHHEGKGKAQTGENYMQYRMRGASALIDGARYSISLIAKDPNKRGVIEAHCSKDKGEGFAPVTMVLNKDTRWFEATDAPVKPLLERLLVEALEQHGEMETADIADMFPAYSRASVFRKLKDMVRFGAIIKTGHGLYAPSFCPPNNQDDDVTAPAPAP